MRKATYIQKLNYKDEQLCRILKASHHMSQKQVESIISKNRIQAYQHQGVLQKIHYIYQGRQHTAYELTSKGRSFIRKHFPQMGNYFYSSATAVRHNIRLAEQVMQHDRWLNERELRQELMSRIERIQDDEERFEQLRRLEHGEYSVPDGAYIDQDGDIVCVEITNENYPIEVIQAKEACSAALGASIRFVKQ